MGANSRKTESDFESLVPSFLRALQALSRRGVRIQPGDALDYVHDFYLDAWPSVRDRFDPKRGSLSAFASVAFYRFTLRRALHASHPVYETIDNALVSEADTDTGAFDKARVREHVAQMGAQQQRVLAVAFSSKYSERQAANELGVTRYRYRELRLEALAELATRVGDSEVLTADETAIVQRLLVERRSARVVADELGLTTAQVRATLHHILRRFETTFRRT